nr:MAG TPA: tail protein [Bacteriophage sp.]DAQ65852.1 MAG TPA: tail protein [Bacteriophage sp.]
MVRKLAEATGSISISMRGEKGESGDTPYVTKTVVDYAITSSVSEAKKWTSTAPDASAAANKGKFLWTRTTYTWSNNKTTENITYTYIGKDGKDGTSVTIKGSKGSTSELPTSGNTLGDGYIISGYLWVYTGTSKTDSTHARGFENVGKIQGEPGAPAVQYYTHIAWMKDSKGTGFTTSADGGDYAYVGVLVDKTATDSEDWTKYDWSCVKGAPGATGNGIKSTEVTYQIGSSGTTPPKGTWSTSVPNITDANPYLWTRTIFKYTNGGSSDPSYSVATRGTKGALTREHNGFESESYKYLSGSGAEAYVDVVCINRKWYQCTKTYTSSSPSVTDGHWSLMNNYTSIATQLLLAENATINMLGSNQINLYTPSNGAMYGSFRVVNNDSDWSLWLGGKDGDSASFAVTRGGAIKATAGTIGSFTIRELQGGYYDFYANYKGIANFSAQSSISLNSQGISASTGVPGNGAQFFFGNNEFTGGDPSWGNGALNVKLSTPYGANSSQTAAYISAMGKSGYTANALELSATGGTDNHAIAIRNGDVVGLRPSFVRITSNYTLTEYNHTVACDNTSAITLTLPSSPKLGQCYTVIQQGGRVTLSTNKSIYDSRNFKTATTWYSDTRGQVSWLWYNGGQWIVCYVTS